MVSSIAYIDFSWDVLLEETMSIMAKIQGFTFNDLISLPFDRYEKVIEILKENKDA